jgi:cytochrome c-type biogenesis protein
MRILSCVLISGLFFLMILSISVSGSQSEILNYSYTGLDSNNHVFGNKFQNKYVLVDTFATWCAPCKEAIPELAITLEERGEYIEIFSLGVDPSETVQMITQFAQETNITWEVGIDKNRNFPYFNMVNTIPTYFIFAPDGELLIHWGVQDGHTADKFIEMIDKYVRELDVEGSNPLEINWNNVWFILIQVLFLGILASFSPCSFPLMPSYFAVLASDNNADRSKIMLSILALGAGIMIVFSIIGLVFSAIIGGFFIRNFSTFIIFQTLIFLIIGLIMIKTPKIIYRIQLPSSLNNLLYKERVQSRIVLFSFLLGLFYTIIALPCAFGYFIISWNLVINANLTVKFLGFLCFSLGATIPFIIIGLFVPELKGSVVQKVHRGAEYVKIALGVIILLFGFYFLVAYRYIWFGFLQL